LCIVKTYSGRVIVRPDTSWEKDNEDFYPQDFVDRISFTPVVFARICKPGKSIGIKFAERYYDGINCGILLYPEDLIDGSAEGFACASCIDHTSFLPFPQDGAYRPPHPQPPHPRLPPHPQPPHPEVVL